MGEKAGQVEAPQDQEQRDKHEGELRGHRDIHGKHVLELVLLVPAHVLAAQDDRAAHQHRADRHNQLIDRAVQADRAHGVDPHIVAGKVAGQDAVDRADRRQKDLDRQQAEHHLCQHLHRRSLLV